MSRNGVSRHRDARRIEGSCHPRAAGSVSVCATSPNHQLLCRSRSPEESPKRLGPQRLNSWEANRLRFYFLQTVSHPLSLIRSLDLSRIKPIDPRTIPSNASTSADLIPFRASRSLQGATGFCDGHLRRFACRSDRRDLVVGWQTLRRRRIATKSRQAGVPVLPRANTIGSNGDGYSENV
jgi:hypothetical protein